MRFNVGDLVTPNENFAASTDLFDSVIEITEVIDSGYDQSYRGYCHISNWKYWIGISGQVWHDRDLTRIL